jgi:hypothetical protein
MRMKQDCFFAAVLGVSMLAMAQPQPKVTNAQFQTQPAGARLSATVDRFQHSGGPLWFGYEDLLGGAKGERESRGNAQGLAAE